jgi:hypothetical protein
MRPRRRQFARHFEKKGGSMARGLLLVTLASLCGNGAFAGSVVTGQDQFTLSYEYVIPALGAADKAEIWIPAAVSDQFQTVTRDIASGGIKSEINRDRDFGNEILQVAASGADSGKSLKISYKVRRGEKGAYAAKKSDAANPIYLRAEPLIPLDARFKKIARDVTAGRKTDLEKGRAIYDYVLKEMKYDKSGTGWGRGDAVYACDMKAGNCTDFHALFIALARSIGLPSRFAIGFTIPADKDTGKIEGYHCWAEFLAGGKWIPIDISEASKDPDLTGYYFGKNPANRFQLSEGLTLVTKPATRDGPINFLIHPYVEINGKVVKNTPGNYMFQRVR